MHGRSITGRRWLLAVVTVLAASGLSAAWAGTPDRSIQQAPAPTCAWRSLGNASRAVYYAAAAMDTDTQQAFLYGGLDASLETQAVLQRMDLSDPDLAKVSLGVVTGVPAAKRFGASGAYRAKGADGAAYFIGGAGDVQDGVGTDDVQVYRPGARQWTSPAVAGVFEERFFHASVYDPLHDVIWVTGGIGRCGLADIAANRCSARPLATKYLRFDPATGDATWVELGGSGGPTTVYGHIMVFDPAGKRVIAIGGTRDGRQGSNDAWQLDLSDADPANARWSDLPTLGAALPRVALHAGALDAARGWIVVYGGVSSNFNTPNENTSTATFALNLALNPPVWTNLGTSLQQRIGAAMIYDPLHQVVILSGGRRISKASPPQDVERDASALGCTGAGQVTQIPPPVTSVPTSTVTPPVTPVDTPTVLPPPVTSVPTGTATSILPPPVTSTPPTPGATGSQVCKFIQRFNRVPPQAISDALANPGHVYGWMLRCNQSVPAGMFNRPRTYLSIHDYNKPYHPLWNPLEYKCGCP